MQWKKKKRQKLENEKKSDFNEPKSFGISNITFIFLFNFYLKEAIIQNEEKSIQEKDKIVHNSFDSLEALFKNAAELKD